jgi:hypothetical protein
MIDPVDKSRVPVSPSSQLARFWILLSFLRNWHGQSSDAILGHNMQEFS